MKKMILLALAALPFVASAQKVSYDDKTLFASVDGTPSFKIDRFGCGFPLNNCHFDVWDSSGKKVARINFQEFNDPTERSASNPEGRVTYYEFIFLESKQKAEINAAFSKTEKMAKYIIQNGLIKEGKMDAAGVDEFVLVNGTKFSARAVRR